MSKAALRVDRPKIKTLNRYTLGPAESWLLHPSDGSIRNSDVLSLLLTHHDAATDDDNHAAAASLTPERMVGRLCCLPIQSHLGQSPTTIRAFAAPPVQG